MTEDELLEFLDEPGHLLRLGTNGTDGMPRVVPIWFIHSDGAIWFTPRAKSAWLDDLRADTSVCATIDETASPMRKLIARGRAELMYDLGDDATWRDVYRDIACRYTPERFADAYIADTIDEPRALFRLVLADADTSTWRMPMVDPRREPRSPCGASSTTTVTESGVYVRDFRTQTPDSTQTPDPGTGDARLGSWR